MSSQSTPESVQWHTENLFRVNIATNMMDANRVNPVFVFSQHQQLTPRALEGLKNVGSVSRPEKIQYPPH